MILKPKQNISATENENYLFPVFLKLHQLKVLIVGGGYVGMEKLSAILQNAPNTVITIVATNISGDIKEIATKYPAIKLLEKPYDASDIDDVDIVFAAVNDTAISQLVSADAKQKGKLINAADKPNLCDFYLGSIVQKGNLKIAISTNGKSPTIAKRIKEFLQLALPDNVNDMLDNMQVIRNKIAGDFSEKVKQLNEITKVLLNDK